MLTEEGIYLSKYEKDISVEKIMACDTDLSSLKKIFYSLGFTKEVNSNDDPLIENLWDNLSNNNEVSTVKA